MAAEEVEESRSRCLTPAFLRARKGAEFLRNTCTFGGPQRQAQGGNQIWLLQHCLLGGPEEGAIAT